MASPAKTFKMACKCFSERAREADSDNYSFIGANRIELISKKEELIGEFLCKNIQKKSVWEKFQKTRNK